MENMDEKLESWLEEDKYARMMYYRATGEMDEMECSKQLRRLIRPLYFPGMKILDVGCSCGHYYYGLKQLGEIRYTGVDISENFINLADYIFSNDNRAQFSTGDIFKLPFEENSFDIVFSYNLLAHLPDYKEPVAQLIRASSRYVFIRALFGQDEKRLMEKAGFGKNDLIYHNTYSMGEVADFIAKLGCKADFIDDDVVITDDIIKKQTKKLGVDKSCFTQSDSKGKLSFKGIEYNYKILKITKNI